MFGTCSEMLNLFINKKPLWKQRSQPKLTAYEKINLDYNYIENYVYQNTRLPSPLAR